MLLALVVFVCLCRGDALADTNDFFRGYIERVMRLGEERFEKVLQLQKMKYENKKKVEQFMDEAKVYEQKGDYSHAEVSYLSA